MKDVYNTKSGRTTVRPDIHQSFIHLSPVVGDEQHYLYLIHLIISLNDGFLPYISMPTR